MSFFPVGQCLDLTVKWCCLVNLDHSAKSPWHHRVHSIKTNGKHAIGGQNCGCIVDPHMPAAWNSFFAKQGMGRMSLECSVRVMGWTRGFVMLNSEGSYGSSETSAVSLLLRHIDTFIVYQTKHWTKQGTFYLIPGAMCAILVCNLEKMPTETSIHTTHPPIQYFHRQGWIYLRSNEMAKVPWLPSITF